MKTLNSTRNILFIDSRVSDYQTLISGLESDTKWVLINAEADGIQQLQSVASDYSELNSIQIISHGSTGTLYLGSTALDASNINSHRTKFGKIGASLSSTGDILLYGCNVAQGENGKLFIESLATLRRCCINPHAGQASPWPPFFRQPGRSSGVRAPSCG